ncbi:MAG: glycosyltransferase [Lachnospiraceae bacterium]|nr:glycosyltransferase [Lachnospiraceae bacterium]
MENKTLLSFVIPCYRSEKTIGKVIGEIKETVAGRSGYDYEIIAVNDCSPDGVFDVLKALAAEDKKIKVISLAKNMGKHSAVMAGYSYVTGDYVVNLDDDCQSPVNRLWDLLELLEADKCDVATAEYITKKESAWKRLGSSANRVIAEMMLDKPKGLRFENFSIIKRFVMDEVIRYKNPFPFLEGLYLRVTKRIISVKMDQRDRGDDNATGFTFWKSLSLFANGFTNFSVKPLRFALIVGTLFAVFGFAFGLFIIIRKLIYPDIPMGWSSMMAVTLFSSGMIMLLLGVIGEYVGRIFICINESPQYVVRETVNVEEEDG